MRNPRVDAASLIAGGVFVAIAVAFAAARRPTSGSTPPVRGAAIFASECASCHALPAELAIAVRRHGPAATIERLLRGAVPKSRDERPTLEGVHPLFDHLTDEDLAAVIEAIGAAGPDMAAPVPFRVTAEDVRRARR